MSSQEGPGRHEKGLDLVLHAVGNHFLLCKLLLNIHSFINHSFNQPVGQSVDNPSLSKSTETGEIED